ncbi:hypothetical protein HPB51_013693 [Rhipicephalus microplus]|uniref:DNA-directed RNA polymerase III subunit n=1 Tax=Rhipicephalus microplus TaxID=6941 RepID=A0A9J6F3B8_RHIMP|nr:hypothetical protein HPB51_013693 [Rhipicephalus microplus]
MAGRGRGRGRGGGMSFNVEQLGLTRQEAALTLCAQPPPTFPAPLVNSEENTYLAVLLHEQRKNLLASSFNILPCTPQQTVERYSDRYRVKAPDVIYDFDYFPAELKISKKTKKRKSSAGILGGGDSIATGIDIQKKLQALEEKEAGGGDSGGEGEDEPGEKKPKEGDDEEEEEGAEEFDEEEELEEETDYINNYFDNGEGYGDDEDDNLDDGAVF